MSPIERAVFLLRQVFDYDYAEIAAMVGKSAENCRQVMHRARRHLPARSSHAPAPHAQQRQVFTQFLQARMNGDMEGLLHVHSDEIVLHTDGGGKVSAARNPLYGPDRVARYLLGIQQEFPHLVKIAIRPTLINGQPGLIGYLEKGLDEKQLLSLGLEGKENIKQQVAWYQRAIEKGKAIFVMVLACTDNQIQEIDIIVNPEKLRHIPALDADDNGTIVC
ncbi:sigma factor-like helix-turn-helix DNA-binding protein [Ktedonobacter racemifer]|uniref:sigma factor-like helix-turn-helix DNA-binding protein n=1 Tax=Ktedonobacter racemifer TaxID=363277 RepID=UPI0006978517